VGDGFRRRLLLAAVTGLSSWWPGGALLVSGLPAGGAGLLCLSFSCDAVRLLRLAAGLADCLVAGSAAGCSALPALRLRPDEPRAADSGTASGAAGVLDPRLRVALVSAGGGDAELRAGELRVLRLPLAGCCCLPALDTFLLPVPAAADAGRLAPPEG
jgi:hypothetical protein